MKVLVTGGCGYIGSHTCLALQAAGMEPVVVDNLCNSKAGVLARIAAISGREPRFYQGDIRDPALLDRIFSEQRIDAVIHFAALKAVGESTRLPLAYYENNLSGTLVLLQAMQRAGVHNLVFSSSATVYGDPASPPIREDFPRSATNPYGRSKLIIEEILEDLQRAEPHWSMTLLRYFNPVGAHESGTMGEDPQGIPNNLMPFLTHVAIGRLDCLSIFGNDYPTIDGTGVRDYIHVMDLAEGHVKALQHCASKGGVHVYNLGTGQGQSVLQMVAAFETASGRPLPYRIEPRRPGDIAECRADPAKAERELGWRARRDLAAMCADSWRWQSANPQGYEA
ncbi:UDP-glucose 4-epimerase GalE [Aeromonas hydrophila]|uniref:UDP-glucose 4-epimerase GalE n=1 Tax=Aeromonas hydrophila TaxID=644 RepID=UPI0004D5A8CA|nr:UDP-glucose 4-epimerase GalE [Aeromonas hydrophila]EJN6955848.1 UDP-glucose 4-epimerase GalE [Aeromonas hydrophila]KER64913.1 UDP-galactose-4-epimerase [Aeromonas hydrophila]MCX4041014.1 UDP-glucose 4-epimerase GalE [Aeromonas hydrophila]OCA64026.1 UDP-glucose 4-epimerase GalE [Aeromonas hydrophila]OCY06116.1 UDP-glucose 4-epimerase GalE [Aeromonas hydrophila]